MIFSYMKINKNLQITFKKIILILTLFSICLNLIYAGELTHVIVSPYNTNVSNIELGSYTSGATTDPIITKIETKYNQFEYDADSNFPTEPYCKYGGQYRIFVTNDPGVKNIKQKFDLKLFYCKTTKDLISYIKIPTSWENKNLVLYCNDGSSIYNSLSNADFLTTGVNTYKMCILKNLDLNSNNTIMYGLEVGNKLIDSDIKYYFNTTTKTSPIVENLDSRSNTNNIYTYNDKVNNRNYIFEYDEIKHFYSLREKGVEQLNTELNLTFTNQPDIGISRVVLYRNINGNQIYGYETALSLLDKTKTTIFPVYKITGLNSIEFSQDLCMNTLASYFPIKSINFDSKKNIICAQDTIIINSDKIDMGTIKNGKSINLFKNIILGLKN